MLPLQARQAATHWFRFFLVEHDRQKAVHRSGLAAQAVPTPRELSTAPAKTAPMLRSDSRRDTDSANNLENSSRRSMIDTSFLEGNWMVILAAVSSAANTNGPRRLPHDAAQSRRGAYNATPAAVDGSSSMSLQTPSQFLTPGMDCMSPGCRSAPMRGRRFRRRRSCCGSEFTAVHVPLQQADAVGQQA